MSFEQTLEKYAALAVNVGVNIQPGQTLSISAPLEAVQFVRLVTEKAYKSGAKHVYVDWNDETLTRLKFDPRLLKKHSLSSHLGKHTLVKN